MKTFREQLQYQKAKSTVEAVERQMVVASKVERAILDSRNFPSPIAPLLVDQDLAVTRSFPLKSVKARLKRIDSPW